MKTKKVEAAVFERSKFKYKTYYTCQREIFHELRASEIACHISQLASDLFI